MEPANIVSREQRLSARTGLLVDLTPKGRNETGPHHNWMDWVRRHDEYRRAKDSRSCCKE